MLQVYVAHHYETFGRTVSILHFGTIFEFQSRVLNESCGKALLGPSNKTVSMVGSKYIILTVRLISALCPWTKVRCRGAG